MPEKGGIFSAFSFPLRYFIFQRMVSWLVVHSEFNQVCEPYAFFQDYLFFVLGSPLLFLLSHQTNLQMNNETKISKEEFKHFNDLIALRSEVISRQKYSHSLLKRIRSILSGFLLVLFRLGKAQ